MVHYQILHYRLSDTLEIWHEGAHAIVPYKSSGKKKSVTIFFTLQTEWHGETSAPCYRINCPIESFVTSNFFLQYKRFYSQYINVGRAEFNIEQGNHCATIYHIHHHIYLSLFTWISFTIQRFQQYRQNDQSGFSSVQHKETTVSYSIIYIIIIIYNSTYCSNFLYNTNVSALQTPFLRLLGMAHGKHCKLCPCYLY